MRFGFCKASPVFCFSRTQVDALCCKYLSILRVDASLDS